jgi:hypothetical protein
MKVLTAGHRYELANFENKDAKRQEIQFIEKLPQQQVTGETPTPGSLTTLVTINDGTTNEEVLEVLINRMNYLQMKFPCRENAIVITKLEESLMWLNKRTADRQNRGVEGKQLK